MEKFGRKKQRDKVYEGKSPFEDARHAPGAGFELVEEKQELHMTPAVKEQKFSYLSPDQGVIPSSRIDGGVYFL